MKTLFTAIAVLIASTLSAQILEPAKWSHSVSKNEVKIGEVVEITFKAKLDDTWYIYSTDQDAGLGPLPAVFEFEADDSYQLVGEITPVGVKEKYDEIWEGNVRILEKYAVFKQKVKILKAKPQIFALVEYQVCTTVDGKCIPGDEEFEIANLSVVN